MHWWGWVVAGAILLGAELAFVDAQFYLVFVGGSAIIVGLVAAAMPLPAAVQWLAFAALALVSMLTFRGPIYRRLRGTTPDLRFGPAGSVLTVPVALAPGESCRIEHRGTSWTARNDGESPIQAGGSARIEQVRGLTLSVRPEH
jgi:membrane protein implicated in regulation of membrane protease activity